MNGIKWPRIFLIWKDEYYTFAGGGRLKGKTIRVIFSVVLFILCAKLLHRSFFG